MCLVSDITPNFGHLPAASSTSGSISTFNSSEFTLTETMSTSERRVFYNWAILLRFAFGINEWRIRGEGNIIVSVGTNLRLTMRDSNNYMLCDHRISGSTSFKKIDSNHIIWVNSDKTSLSAWENMYRELLGLRFTSNDICEHFLKTIEANQSKFVVDDSWTCLQCYRYNDSMLRHCLRCLCAQHCAEDDCRNDRQEHTQTSKDEEATAYHDDYEPIHGKNVRLGENILKKVWFFNKHKKSMDIYACIVMEFFFRMMGYNPLKCDSFQVMQWSSALKM